MSIQWFQKDGIDQPNQQVFVVKRLKETAGYVQSMPGGVRGRGREAPLYSICNNSVVATGPYCDINYFQIIKAAFRFVSGMDLKIYPKNENQRPILSISLVCAMKYPATTSIFEQIVCF